MWNLKNGLYIEEEFTKNNILNFTTTTLYGDLKLEKNRNEFLEKQFGIKNIVYGIQTHSDNIEIVSEKDVNNRFYAVDGFITDKKNVPIAVFTADCLSVFIYDPKTPSIGMIHSGWRSSKENIVSK